ncbi:MAG TPA: cytochrome P450 [Allosphingosinicella sp.]|nr:cytochrome P450 [Allosphingosinicella sp.]
MTVLSRLRVRIGRQAAPASSAAAIDLGDPAVAIDPFPHYERLRSAGDVHFLPRHGFWLVLGYEPVKAAFAQPQLFSSSWRGEVDRVLLGADPPRHAPMRRIVARFFGAEALDRLAATASATAERLVRPELDIVGDYAAPLARGVAAALIGFDEETVAEILALGRRPLAELTASLDSLAHHAALYRPLVGEQGGAIGDAEARSLIRLLWLASTASTERIISFGVLRLLRDEAARRAVAADRRLVGPLIEEVLRLHPAEHIILRRTTAPTTLAGIDIPAQAEVQLCVAAANRDPARFDDPAALRLDRPTRRHLAFGGGIHQCVGAPLSRRVAAAAMATLLDHMTDLRPLQPLDEIPYLRTLSELAPERLAVAL